MVDDEVQCRIGVAKLPQRTQQGRHPWIARVNRCGTEPSVSAQHVCQCLVGDKTTYVMWRNGTRHAGYMVRCLVGVNIW